MQTASANNVPDANKGIRNSNAQVTVDLALKRQHTTGLNSLY